MYAYLLIIGLVVFFWLVGKVVVIAFQIEEEWEHPLVLGFFAYFGVFSLVSIPCIALGINWAPFYLIQLIILAIITLGSIIYLMMQKAFKGVNIQQKISKNIKENWTIYCALIIFSFIYLLSSNATYYQPDGFVNRFNLPLIDNDTYLARITRYITLPSLNQSDITAINGAKSYNIGALLAIWELLQAFVYKLTQVNIFELLHTTFALFGYVFFFLCFDEMLKQMKRFTDKAENHRVLHFLGLAPLLFFVLIHDKNEFFKLLFFPWYGNVYSTVGFILITITLLLLALRKKQAIFFLLVLPFVMTGFSGGIITEVAFLLPLIIYSLAKNTRYTLNPTIKKIIIGYFIALDIVFLFTAFYMVKGSFYSIFSEGMRLGIRRLFITPSLFTERNYFFESIVIVAPIVAIGIFVYLFDKSETKDKQSAELKTIYLYFVTLVGIVSIPKLGNIFFNVFDFAFRRTMASVMMFLTVYSIYVIFTHGRTQWKRLAIFMCGLVFAATSVTGIFILKERAFYKFDNVFNISRITPTAMKVYEYFSKIDTEKKVCVYDGLFDGRGLPTENGTIDYYLPIVATDNGWTRECDRTIYGEWEDNLDDVNYIIIESDNFDGIARIEEKYIRDDEIITNEEHLYIYIRK